MGPKREVHQPMDAGSLLPSSRQNIDFSNVTSRTLALTSSGPWTDLTSMCLTSTCHRTTMDQLLFLHQTLATDIPTLLDRSRYPASILILLPLGHEKVPLPLGCFHTTSWFSPRTPPPENLRLKLSRWAQITTAAPARHFLPRFNQRAPRVPLLLRPPSIHLTILIYRALIFAAPSLSLVTLLLCFSTRASTLPACPTPRRCSTAWPWHPLQHSPI